MVPVAEQELAHDGQRRPFLESGTDPGRVAEESVFRNVVTHAYARAEGRELCDVVATWASKV
jgi:hypothetical protein